MGMGTTSVIAKVTEHMEQALREELSAVGDKVRSQMHADVDREVDAAVARVGLAIARYFSVVTDEDRIVVMVKFHADREPR